jgi:hypothetical protein
VHDYQPFTVIGFHSCDKEVGLKVLNGEDELLPSQNAWDWLGEGVYFWEQNPLRALEYAEASAKRTQFNKVPIKTPFVLGAIIDLGNCLNLVESGSLEILSQAYKGLDQVIKGSGGRIPGNKKDNRALDCAVIQFIHQSNEQEGKAAYDTVRCAFPEGQEAYEGASITSKLHLQVCVRNTNLIKGFFLPRPLNKYNPHLTIG